MAEDIAQWLEGLGLGLYVQTFAENDVDAEMLHELTGDDLKELGVASLGHRKKLLRAIASLPLDAAASDGAEAPVRAGSRTDLGEGERREVTVLFADLSGFTKLSSKLDAEETHALLNRFFETVDSIVVGYGGTVDKHIGDNVMAVFGAPVAHGNDPERAVRAALDIHGAMPELGESLGRRLAVHIGIASGDVVASGTGSAAHREYTVTGDSVNLAARLDDMAKRGETRISAAVHRAVAGLFECEAAGEANVKGLDSPVRAWRVLGPAASGRAARTPFVGRRNELRQFASVIEACRETGNGQAFYMCGEAGIGKTRLMDEFQALAGREGFACHSGHVLDFGVGKGQDAIRAIVRSLVQIPQGAGKEVRRTAAKAALSDGLLKAEQTVYLNDLLDLPQPDEQRAMYDAMDNATRIQGKQETVAALLQAVSGRQPVLVTVEDLHWADGLTLGHLAAMTKAAAACPAVVAMTSRLEGDPLDQAWRGATRGAALMTIDLPPLKEAEALELAGKHREAGDHFARQCISRAEGNPLFLEQLLLNAEEAADESLPGSLQSLVLARMDRLEAPDKAALQAASVIGQRFSLETLRHLIESPQYTCAGLVEHYLVRAEGEDYRFAHALIQEGVYASLLRTRNGALHRRAADWFAERDPSLHAEHLDRAGDPAAPGAFLAAARAQSHEYRYERARVLASRGVELAGEREDKFALTSFLGQVQHDLGAVADSIVSYQDALGLAGDDTERCHARIGIAAGMRVADRMDEAIEALEKAEAAATGEGLVADLSRIHHLRGNIYFPLGNIEGCLEQHELALEYAQAAHSSEGEARALGGMGDAEYARGRMKSAHGYFNKCIALARDNGFGLIEVANLPMAASARFYFNEPRGSVEDGLVAAEAAEIVGHHRAEVIARRITQMASYEMGDLTLARENLEALRVLVRHLGSKRFEPGLLELEAILHRAEGRRSEAIKILEQGIEICSETGMRFLGPRLLAQLALATDDADARRKALADGEELLREGSLGHNHLLFHRDAIEACLNVGEWDRVERYASALEEYTRPEPLAWSDFFIARGRAIAAWGVGRRDEATAAELARLRDEAEDAGLKIALPALEAVLAGG